MLSRTHEMSSKEAEDEHKVMYQSSIFNYSSVILRPDSHDKTSCPVEGATWKVTFLKV